jgi:signal transduction histidine kinase
MRINNRLLQLAFYLMMVGVLISFLLLKKISGRVVRAEVRNIELQNSFMTNASHELKTPLAVIRANTEVLEMTQGENEWTSSTMRQVDRMDGLIKNLVMITKAQEQDTKENRKDVDVSAVAEETAGNFKALAMQEEKELSLEITKGIHMKAMEGQIRQLVSILLDNAIKYCDEKGKITVSLKKKGRQIHLDVSNSYAAGEGVDCLRFFDRFYREDESHNVERGGYGIGLSIAESIVRGYNGSIEASFYRGIITFSCRL